MWLTRRPEAGVCDGWDFAVEIARGVGRWYERRIEVHGQDVVGPKAGVDDQHFAEALQQHPGGNQHDNSEALAYFESVAAEGAATRRRWRLISRRSEERRNQILSSTPARPERFRKSTRS